MGILTCHDLRPVRLDRDPCFRPCDPQEGDELHANGILEFNITRLLAFIRASGRFLVESVLVGEMS
jgi:hypothetical protein